MARIAQGTPLYKEVDNHWEQDGTADKTLNVTLINFKPFDLLVTFEIDGTRYKVDRQFVSDVKDIEPYDETVARGAVGASGGTVHTDGDGLK